LWTPKLARVSRIKFLPVVPHKAVAEIIGKVNCCDAWMAERKVVGVVLFGAVAMVSLTTAAGCSVV